MVYSVSMKSKKYHVGLVIGRFQPFHKGHVYLIHKALKRVEKITIGIGSSNVKDSNNPLDFETRKQLVAYFIKKEKLQNKIVSIISLPDYPDDLVWLAKTREKTGIIDVVIGNNDWVKGIFEHVHIPVVTVRHYKRYVLEGYKIRGLIREKKEWENRVPLYLVETTRDAFSEQDRVLT